MNFNIWIRDGANNWVLIAHKVGQVAMLAYRDSLIQPYRIETVK